jgi:hypothetical protein
MVLDIQNLLHAFELWKVQAVRRNANCVAHNMAIFAKKEHMARTWKGDYPKCIRELVPNRRSSKLLLSDFPWLSIK